MPRPAITVNEDYDQIVIPVCLGWDSTIPVPKTTHLVAGWGRTSNDRADQGDNVRQDNKQDGSVVFPKETKNIGKECSKIGKDVLKQEKML